MKPLVAPDDGQPQRKSELAGRVAAAMLRAWEDASARRRPLLADEVAWHFKPVVLPLKPELSGPEELLLACVDDASDGKGDLSDPTSVYPRIFAAQDVVYARRARAGYTIDLTCLQFGSAARVLGMPGELFVVRVCILGHRVNSCILVNAISLIAVLAGVGVSAGRSTDGQAWRSSYDGCLRRCRPRVHWHRSKLQLRAAVLRNFERS